MDCLVQDFSLPRTLFIIIFSTHIGLNAIWKLGETQVLVFAVMAAEAFY